MTVFADTTALYAVMSRADQNHDAAAEAFRGFSEGELVIHNYLAVELVSLVQRRSPVSVTVLIDGLLPSLQMIWVDEETHSAAMSALRHVGGRHPSIVDWVSFELMRRQHITTAFAFDRDFLDQGFECVP